MIPISSIGIALGLFITTSLQAQSKLLKGTITDSAGKALEGATITLLNGDHLVIRFTFSDKDGNFYIDATPQAAWLAVSFLGFKRIEFKLAGHLGSPYQIKLATDEKTLNTVLIKAKPLVQVQGDTLHYSVPGFATSEDRSIGDVLRRLPGIEIAQDGAIFFNGQKVENLYIDGDDVMDGRYGLATKVIKKELIEMVDVINHHQPVAVLRNKVATDKIALNLVLKEDQNARLSASTRVGLGLPAQVEASLSPIVLTKKIKSVNRIAFNNSGIDYRNELKQLGTSNFTESVPQNQRDVLLTSASPSDPDMPSRYYYFNQAMVVNFNEHYKTKQGLQVKFNGSLFYDRNKRSSSSIYQNFLLHDTIRYADFQKTLSQPLWVNVGMNIMHNTEQYFVSNTTRFALEKNSTNGFVSFNTTNFSQVLQLATKRLINDFNFIPALQNKGILELALHSEYLINKQNLNIGEGYFFAVPPQQKAFDKVNQSLNSPSQTNSALFSYKFSMGPVLHDYKMGYQSFRQHLMSQLSLQSNDTLYSYQNDRGNDVQFETDNLFFAAQYQLKWKKMRSQVELPLSLQRLSIKQPLYQVAEHGQFIQFLPRIQVTYNLDNEKYLQGSFRIQNSFNDISNSYKGAILVNYKSLHAYLPSIQYQRTESVGLGYNYQKSIKLLFANLGISYTHTTGNNIAADSFSNNIRQTAFYPFPADQKTILAQGGVSKYIISAKTKLTLKLECQSTLATQLLNAAVLTVKDHSLSLNFSANRKLGKTIDLLYQPSLLWSRSILEDLSKSNQFAPPKYLSLDQQGKISLSLYRQVYLEGVGTHRVIQNNGEQRSFFFLDINFKILSLIRRRMDLELACTNLWNMHQYAITVQSGEEYFQGTYPLRERTIMLSCNYSF